MPIRTDRNPNYGPPLVNQKYAPLVGMDFDNADRPSYTGLLRKRMAMLRGTGLIDGQLELAAPNWNNIIQAEAGVGRLAPLVVISSKRSGWIKSGIEAGNAQLVPLHHVTAGVPGQEGS